jgi:glycosyltransferase involved in cell wall biosynthesis
MAAPVHTVSAAIDEYLVKDKDFDAPISLLRDVSPGIALEKLSHASVIHLHGINGAISLNALQLLSHKARLVWTLHDMNPFTGTCHYSLGCSRFVEGCQGCPAVRSPFRQAVSKRLQLKKNSLREFTNLAVVTPSSWLANQASMSAVMADTPIVVIPNPVAPEYFEKRKEISDNRESLSAIVVAQNLSDPVKNVRSAVDAFLETTQDTPFARLTLVGKGGDEFRGPGIHHAGAVGKNELVELYRQADVLLVPSLAENAPLVIAEAAASGCRSFVSDAGGMGEMVQLIGAGETFSSTRELVKLLGQIPELSQNHKRALRKTATAGAMKHFSPEAVVAKYGKVYAENR